MKTVIYITLPFLIFFQINLNAQEVVASGGDFLSNSNGSMSVTIGEPVIETFSGSVNIMTQGFQQSKLIVFAINENPDPDPGILVYPNPTGHVLNIKAQNMPDKKLRYKLYDSMGKKLLDHNFTGPETSVPFNDLPRSTYILKIYSSQKELRSFKIIRQ